MTTGETRLISLNTTTHLIKSELKRRGGGRGGDCIISWLCLFVG